MSFPHPDRRRRLNPGRPTVIRAAAPPSGNRLPAQVDDGASNTHQAHLHPTHLRPPRGFLLLTVNVGLPSYQMFSVRTMTPELLGPVKLAFKPSCSIASQASCAVPPAEAIFAAI